MLYILVNENTLEIYDQDYLKPTSKPHFIPFASLALNMVTCRNMIHGRISNAYLLLCKLIAMSAEICSKVYSIQL